MAQRKKDVPPQLAVIHHDAALEIVRRWFGFWAFVYAGIAAAVYVVLYLMYRQGDDTRAVFWGTGLVIGFMITYLTAMQWLNRTHILVTTDRITVRHRPLPYFDHATVAIADIDRIRAVETLPSPIDERSTTRREVVVITRSGKKVRLVGFLKSAEQAVFIKEQIEKYLKRSTVPARDRKDRR